MNHFMAYRPLWSRNPQNYCKTYMIEKGYCIQPTIWAFENTRIGNPTGWLIRTVFWEVRQLTTQHTIEKQLLHLRTLVLIEANLISFILSSLRKNWPKTSRGCSYSGSILFFETNRSRFRKIETTDIPNLVQVLLQNLLRFLVVGINGFAGRSCPVGKCHGAASPRFFARCDPSAAALPQYPLFLRP